MLPCWLGSGDPALQRLLPKDAYVPRALNMVVHHDVHRVARTRLIFDALGALLAREKKTLAGV